jgi:anti-sigma factor RsiW
MTANIVNLGSPMHQNVQDLLPWFVMGTLDAEDRSVVDEHLRTCASCQHEVEWQQQLRQAHGDALPERDVERAFAALRVRLPAKAAARAPSRQPLSGWLQSAREWWRSQTSWVGWTLALQSALILGLGVALVAGADKSAQQPGVFHALSRPGAARAPSELVVVFAPQTPVAEMRRVLLASGTRIVDGPTAADAYILSVASERAEQSLELLRAEHSVLLVQSLASRDAH